MAYALVRKMKDGTIKAYGASAGMSPWHQDPTRIWKIKSEDKAHEKGFMLNASVVPFEEAVSRMAQLSGVMVAHPDMIL